MQKSFVKNGISIQKYVGDIYSLISKCSSFQLDEIITVKWLLEHLNTFLKET